MPRKVKSYPVSPGILINLKPTNTLCAFNKWPAPRCPAHPPNRRRCAVLSELSLTHRRAPNDNQIRSSKKCARQPPAGGLRRASGKGPRRLRTCPEAMSAGDHIAHYNPALIPTTKATSQNSTE
ncbi:hypothetical protein TNIN_194381 [Trichonephila inaurata madagascariensis]|uniref:Uncharacterized protein n=1 Tax=Trichonephila inaurata madagascariensis TaxID=2747483 RepID=A0A8X6YJ35_9ARAC|nr:hypothetical protein TNIN_194381 [Trichonephila inaurata madagascariensis]